MKADIESRLGVIRAIDTGKAKGYNRPLFVGSIINKVGTLANKGDVEMVRKTGGDRTQQAVPNGRKSHFRAFKD